MCDTIICLFIIVSDLSIIGSDWRGNSMALLAKKMSIFVSKSYKDICIYYVLEVFIIKKTIVK